MDHMKVLKRALQITWKYRALWLIGLLLVLAGGGVWQAVSGPPNGSDTGWKTSSGEGWDIGPEQFPHFWETVVPIIAIVAAVILTLVLVGLVVGVLRVILRYVTRSSLIQMVDRYEESGEEMRFGAGFRLGWNRSAFRMFLISLMLKLPVALLMFVMIAPLVTLAIVSFIQGDAWIAMGIVLLLLIVPAVFIGVALGVVIGPIIEVAYRACALQQLGAWEAVRSATGLIRRNLGATALQWLLLVGIGIAWKIVLFPLNLVLLMLGFLIGGLPAMFMGGLSALIAGPPLGIGLGVVVFIVVFLIIVVLPNLVLTTAATVFHSTMWTLTYRELKAIDSGVPAVEWSEPVKADPEAA